MNKNFFTFGEPEPISTLLDYLETYDNGQFYETPINQNDLTRLAKTGSHHPSALQTKTNILTSTFIGNGYLSTTEFNKFATGYLTLGNAYLEIIYNRLGDIIQLKALPAKYMRRTSNLKDYVLLRPYNQTNEYFYQDRVLHFANYDLDQEIYGFPYYIGALHSIKLNESATIFRRRYYDNGSHAGFILYMSDPNINENDFDELKKQLKNSKGQGNFKNILLRAPSASKDGIQLIPIADIAAKDEFLNIKSASRDDILAAHRVPPQLLGIIPNNTGGFGDVEKAAGVFARNEIKPIHTIMRALNERLNIPAFDFIDYTIATESIE